MDAVYETEVHARIKEVLATCEEEKRRYATGYPSMPSEHEWALMQAMKYEVISLLLSAALKAGEVLFGKEKA